MEDNTKSNSATDNENKGILSGLLDKYLNRTEEIDEKIEQLVKTRYKWDNKSEDSLLNELVKLSNEYIGNEAMCFAVKKSSNMEEYFYYLREIRDLLTAGYPAGKVFEIVGKVDSKALFNVVR